MAEGSLEIYCGNLGSGKTSMACDRALEHLVKGGTVVSNIEWYPDKVAKWMHEEHGLRFDPARLIKIEDGEEVWRKAVIGTEKLPTMLLIDEAHVEHNSRDWNKTHREQIMFNTMVRKLRIHLVYITQDENNMDKQFRRMAQRVTYVRNLSQYQLMGGLFSLPFKVMFRVPYLCGPGVKPTRMQPEVVWGCQSWGMFNSHSLVGRAAETFSALQTAPDSPLERIPRPARPVRWHLWLPLAVGLSEVLTR